MSVLLLGPQDTEEGLDLLFALESVLPPGEIELFEDWVALHARLSKPPIYDNVAVLMIRNASDAVNLQILRKALRDLRCVVVLTEDRQWLLKAAYSVYPRYVGLSIPGHELVKEITRRLYEQRLNIQGIRR